MRFTVKNVRVAKKFDINHVWNGKKGGFVINRHNTIRNFQANLLRKVYTNVETEPFLQPVNGKQVVGPKDREARPDIRAIGVWGNGTERLFWY